MASQTVADQPIGGLGSKETATSKKSDTLHKESIKEMISRLRAQKIAEQDNIDCVVEDVYEKAASIGPVPRKKTGIIYDDSMALHKCEWDENYPENPERYLAVMDRIKELHLLPRCEILIPVKATAEQVETMHSKEHVEKLRKISNLTSSLVMEEVATCFDAVYFNEHTYNAALTSAGCVLTLLREVCTKKLQNGFAVVRPPGHHAMRTEYCGYCYLNNVAIAADHALTNRWSWKILIVDVDVHHGQGIQQMFYADNRVLYFSIHRYEHGEFWPNLRESNFDYIGEDKGKGFNVNVPLNATGLGDDDYLAIVQNILLPLAYEFQPTLILVSAGYDAAIGCFEGLMNVTPGFYGHLITLLSGLAEGRVVVCLEGGYFLPSLAEGAVMTLKALLGDAPAFLEPVKPPHEAVVEVINNVKYALRPYWRCFKHTFLSKPNDDNMIHEVKALYKGEPIKPPYETRNCYPIHEPGSIERNTAIIMQLRKDYESLDQGATVSFAYDVEMLKHKPPPNSGFPEIPERLEVTFKIFCYNKLNERCKRLELKKVDIAWMEAVHSMDYLQSIKYKRNFKCSDIYATDDTWPSIEKCVECVISVIDSVMTKDSRSGIAIIRPPGHHAEREEPYGFCFVNNVCVGANYAMKTYGVQRILILDFDVHHGNGTQRYFYNSKDVFYISIHRYDNGSFYPKGDDGNSDHVGEDAGEGFNMNIPLNGTGNGCMEYIEIFHRLVLPVAYSYAPELIIVSAGFDAGINDQLGHYKVMPETFGHFIQMLKPLAGGRLVIVTEGGYNPNTVAYSLSMCTKALLGDPLPTVSYRYRIKMAAQRTIDEVINIHKKYWPVLETSKVLPGSFAGEEE